MGYNVTDGEENWLEAYYHTPAWYREMIVLNLNQQNEITMRMSSWMYSTSFLSVKAGEGGKMDKIKAFCC